MNYEEQSLNLSPSEIAQLLRDNADLQEQIASVKSQLDWFKRQLFGRKSEKLTEIDTSVIYDMFAGPNQVENDEAKQEETITVHEHTRKNKKTEGTPDDSGLRFGPDVPVQEIEMLCPELEADPEGYEVIGTKVTYRLAQRTAAFVILKYTRKIIKPKQVANAKPITPPAPANVLDKSFADVSFVAGLLIDKFDYHLPLYRQHRRLLQTGITLSRSTLTNICYKAILLLEPIFDALFRSVLLSKILAMDETPIKYSRKTKGKMKTGYYWPIFGDNNEIVFCFSPSRATRVIHELLGDFSGTLVTDGYTAYERYSNKMGTATRSQCWSHARRPFDKALKMEPNDAKQGLQMIAALYQHEGRIAELKLSGDDKLAYRQEYSKPIVDAFFGWIKTQRQRQDLVNSNPLSKALVYAQNRERAMRVFLDDPDVPLDTNHLERQIRYIAMGKKSWLFCWSEVGAKQVGIIQSLICSCKLQGVDPTTYLIDVLQRVATHPASQVDDLIPRNWKQKFADNPMKSDLDQ